MTSSLVGSEMCIRDSPRTTLPRGLPPQTIRKDDAKNTLGGTVHGFNVHTVFVLRRCSDVLRNSD
eukprot:8196434-Prorocentrum_lima.AAC.1